MMLHVPPSTFQHFRRMQNVLDELDAPGEFFHDVAAKKLYLWNNASGTPANGTVVAPQLTVLVNATGTQDQPVVGLSFLGMGFRDSAPNFLGPHGTPSGGDWAVGRSGALFFEGVNGVTIAGCLLTSLDGNAVFMSGYVRGANVSMNEFSLIGETAISQWGYTDGSPVPGMGFDATKGNQPRGTVVEYNYVHEVGLWTKQNSFYFQSESFNNIIQGNLAFNGPRAGINFDDGMGGNSSVVRNILANFCRESSDHGYVIDLGHALVSVLQRSHTAYSILRRACPAAGHSTAGTGKCTSQRGPTAHRQLVSLTTRSHTTGSSRTTTRPWPLTTTTVAHGTIPTTTYSSRCLRAPLTAVTRLRPILVATRTSTTVTSISSSRGASASSVRWLVSRTATMITTSISVQHLPRHLMATGKRALDLQRPSCKTTLFGCRKAPPSQSAEPVSLRGRHRVATQAQPSRRILQIASYLQRRGRYSASKLVHHE